MEKICRIKLPAPKMQIEFSNLLINAKNEYLKEALGRTIKEINIQRLDVELSNYVPQEALNVLAQKGLRGEILFPTPLLLNQNPKLLGYYRLLLGFSQKAFYTSETGLVGFKSMEEDGVLTETCNSLLKILCDSLVRCAHSLLKGINSQYINIDFLDDLALLTLGPQLRGGANVQKGTSGNLAVMDAIYKIVRKATIKKGVRSIEVKNAAKRKVMIEFAADPDIRIRELMSKDNYRNIIAIEIKGGTDFSNIHNRVGEAEKSHQKAKQSGFVECWTIVNVDRINLEMAGKESPSTNRFYKISSIASGKGDEFNDFRNRIIALTGIINK